MKAGRTIVELAQELMRQKEAKRDFLASTETMKIGTIEREGQRREPVITWPGQQLEINEIAHDQIGAHVGIPAKYYDRMRGELPELLANNINAWFAKYPAPRMVRTLDGTARAFLSNSYRPLENCDLAEAVLPVLSDLKLEIMSCEVTDRRLYIKAVDERIKKDVPSGRRIGDGSHVFFDTCSPAVIISNSEVGLGQLSVETGVFTKVCTNLATFADGGMKRRHVGVRNSLESGESIQHLLTDETRKATDRAIWMQVRDVVAGAFNEVRFGAAVDKLKGLAQQPIKGDPAKVVELTAKHFGASENEGTSILRHLIEGGDLTRYGLFNAFTRTAQDISSYDRATEFEKIGGEIVELPASQWQRIAEAA